MSIHRGPVTAVQGVRGVLLLTLLTLTGIAPVGADVYKYVDSQGRVFLTDEPPHSGYKLIMRTPGGRSARPPKSRIDFRSMDVNRKRHAPAIARAAREARLPEALVHAVIVAESAYDQNAVSSAGAVGLMQLMPDTARRYGVRDRKDPVQNISGGTRYLRDLLGMFDNNIALALAGYNAGEGAVEKYGRRIPPYPETQNYVRKVLTVYRQLREEQRAAVDAGTPELASATTTR